MRATANYSADRWPGPRREGISLRFFRVVLANSAVKILTAKDAKTNREAREDNRGVPAPADKGLDPDCRASRRRSAHVLESLSSFVRSELLAATSAPRRSDVLQFLAAEIIIWRPNRCPARSSRFQIP